MIEQLSAEVEGLRIAENLCLPLEAATWVISYLAKRGAGKTHNAAVQAEEMRKAGIPIVVIDGMGIWWGLRVKADEEGGPDGPGLPVVVFGGEHKDLDLIPEKAAEIAKAVVESNISCVLDLSQFSKLVARRIVRDFLDALYRLNRVVRHVFIEESDMFAPQKTIGPEEALTLSSVDNFARRGGNHNLGCTLITQRSAVLNKDILTQSDCLIILRTLAPQDKKAIQAWVEEQTDEDKEELKKWYDSLKSLRNGEAWVWHPEKPDIYEKVMFRKRETFHATREFILSPQASRITLMSVDEFVERFEKVFKTTSAQVSLKGTVNPEITKELEEYRSGQRLAESVQQRLKVDEQARKATLAEFERVDDERKVLQKKLFDAEKDAEWGRKFKELFQELLPTTSIPAAAPTNGPGSIIVSESIPEIRHKVERPIVETDESSYEGRVITLTYHDFFKEKRRANAIAAEIHRVFAVQSNAKLLNVALGSVVQKKVLQREQSPNGGWEYWLVEGAKERIREVEAK